jgi:hypothetical protein
MLPGRALRAELTARHLSRKRTLPVPAGSASLQFKLCAGAELSEIS